jgi:HKD family nuclease
MAMQWPERISIAMPTKQFLLQGFTDKTHANAVNELLDIPDIEKVILSVAFISESGVGLIEAGLKRHHDYLTIYAGIRNDITSHQALTKLHALGASVVTVDTGSRHILFHPKLYLARSDVAARLIVGSANLTLGGLNNNIEAGMILDFDLSLDSERAVVETIEDQFEALANEHPQHVVLVNQTADLDQLLASGRLIDENLMPPSRPATSSGQDGGKDAIPRIKLAVKRIHRTLKQARASQPPYKGKRPRADVAAPDAVMVLTTLAAGVQFELVWESKPLERRDLNIPDGANTNKTGSISLDKGLLPVEVDHRHYFRETIFNCLNWSPTNRLTTEEAYAKFHLVISGISYGEFDLRIGHTIGAESKAYKQNNAMTRLSWGPAKAHVGKESLKDRTLSLFRDLADPTRFVLEID